MRVREAMVYIMVLVRTGSVKAIGGCGERDCMADLIKI